MAPFLVEDKPCHNDDEMARPRYGLVMASAPHRWFDGKSARLDQFGILLALTVIVIALLSLVDLDSSDNPVLSRAVAAVIAMLVGSILLLGLRASGMRSEVQRIVDGIVIVATAVLIAVSIVGGMAPSAGASQLRAIGFLIVVGFAIVTPIVIVRRLLQHRQVHLATVLGAIAAYLLIPLSYFYLFISIEQLTQESFFKTAEPTTSFMYFSLATLTTLGYGDLAASGNLGQFLSTSEAVVGQIYLVTCVALIMGLFIQGWRSDRSAQSTEES
jgi:hypothetical protein